MIVLADESDPAGMIEIEINPMKLKMAVDHLKCRNTGQLLFGKQVVFLRNEPTMRRRLVGGLGVSLKAVGHCCCSWHDGIEKNKLYGHHGHQCRLSQSVLKIDSSRHRAPQGDGERSIKAKNTLNQTSKAHRSNQRLIADFARILDAQNWLHFWYVLCLFSTSVSSCFKKADRIAKLFGGMLIVTVWRRREDDLFLHDPKRTSFCTAENVELLLCVCSIDRLIKWVINVRARCMVDKFSLFANSEQRNNKMFWGCDDLYGDNLNPSSFTVAIGDYIWRWILPNILRSRPTIWQLNSPSTKLITAK